MVRKKKQVLESVQDVVHKDKHPDLQVKHVPKKKDELELTLSKTYIAIAAVLLLLGVVFFIYFNMPRSGEDITLVTLNGEKISHGNLELLYSQLQPDQQQRISKAEFLNITINEKLLMQRAASVGISASAADAEQYINDVLSQSGLKAEDFWRNAQSRGASRNDVIGLARNRLIMNKLFEKELYPLINVTVEEAQAVYDGSPQLFEVGEQVRASHILVENESRAKELLSMLKSAKNLSQVFAEFAMNYSIDSGSAVNGGDLGFFSKGMMVKPFEDAAFGLGVGKYTKDPVKSQFGYHLILVKDKKPANKLSFDQAKERILQSLRAQKITQAAHLYVLGLQNKATIVYNEKAVQKLNQ